MQQTSVLIVGAGHSGVAVASELDRLGFDGTVLLVNGEDSVPYHRPPLSKAWLKGDVVDDREISLQSESFYDLANVVVMNSTRIAALDLRTNVAVTDRGAQISFQTVVLATGADARPLEVPGGDDPSVLVLRDLPDALALKEVLRPDFRLGIIGGGFVGLEVAATARHLGCAPHVFVRGAGILTRSVSPLVAQHLRELHESHGVRFDFNTTVTKLVHGSGGSSVVTSGGASHDVDAVLAAVGSVPRDYLAQAAGVLVNAGVVVDGGGRSSIPHLFAVGDVARVASPQARWPGRLESVHAANDQAKTVAASIVGVTPPAPTTPWFWSDQYDAKLQIAGVVAEATTAVVRGDPSSDSFSVVHLAADRIECVEAVNCSIDFAAGRRLIGSGAIIDTHALVDADTIFDAIVED